MSNFVPKNTPKYFVVVWLIYIYIYKLKKKNPKTNRGWAIDNLGCWQIEGSKMQAMQSLQWVLTGVGLLREKRLIVLHLI